MFIQTYFYISVVTIAQLCEFWWNIARTKAFSNTKVLENEGKAILW